MNDELRALVRAIAMANRHPDPYEFEARVERALNGQPVDLPETPAEEVKES